MKLRGIFFMMLGLQFVTLQASESLPLKKIRRIESLETFLNNDLQYYIVRRQGNRVNALSALFVVQEIPPSIQSLSSNIFLDFEKNETGICITFNYSGNLKVVQINRLFGQPSVNMHHLDKVFAKQHCVHVKADITNDELNLVLNQLKRQLQEDGFMHSNLVVSSIKAFDACLATE